MKLLRKKSKFGTNTVLLWRIGKWVFQLGVHSDSWRWFGRRVWAFAYEQEPAKPVLEYMVDPKPPISVYKHDPLLAVRLQWRKSPWTTKQEIAAGNRAALLHKKRKKQ